MLYILWQTVHADSFAYFSVGFSHIWVLLIKLTCELRLIPVADIVIVYFSLTRWMTYGTHILQSLMPSLISVFVP